MSVLSVQLLGHFAASLNGVALTTLNTSRLQALFACLLLCPQAVFRHHLAYRFWPDSSESQARTNLRNLVYLLRQALPDFEVFIHSDAKTLQWRKDAPVRLDVHEFEQLLAFSPGSVPDREKMERAISLYQGDLLPDCYEDWIIPERERLRQAFLAALEAVAETAERNRDYPAALQYTRRLLQEDPFHAAANRQLIRLYALTGSQAAALKAYEAYADLLKRELGISPEPETQILYEQLCLSAIHSPPSAPEPAPMVGRHSEWAMAQAAWRQAARGNPGALLIIGEAGIGKTRLVEELVHWASRQGVRTAVASCYPAEGSLPYAPVVNWLQSLPLPRLDNIWLTEVSRLVPEVLSTNPQLAAPKPLTESWQRQRMFEALAKAVLGNNHALLLVIEDIHWCDQDTLEWLHYLLRYNARSPLLLVATERSGETTAPDHPLKKLQTTLAAAGKLSQIKLHPLNEAECWQLAVQVAEERTNQRLQGEFTAQIFRETEGNPLFVVEMVRLGHPFQTQVRPAGETASLSDKVQRVLNWRIDQLSAQTRELACMAATLGREFHLDVLLRASGLKETALIKALNELLLRQIVHEQTPDRYDFTHDKLRQAVLSGLSSAHTRLLHRKAAEAYLYLTRDSLQPRNSTIAGHYESAGLIKPAIQYYRLAAESAENIFSTADAIHNLKRAIELVDASGAGVPTGTSPDELAVMLAKMGDLLALDGKYPQAQAHFERALAQTTSHSALWRSKVYCNLSDALTAQYRHAEAHAALDQAEQALYFAVGDRTLAEKSEWIQIQLTRIQLCYWENNPDRMDELIQKVGLNVEAAGSIDQKIALLSAQYFRRLRRERYRLSQETVDLARRRLELSETLADPFALATTQFQYGFALLWHGDFGEAREWLATGYAATGRIGARLWQLRALAYLCIANRILNNLPAVREQTQELLEMAPAINEPTYYGIGQANLGWLAWRDGDAVKASQLCNAAIETWHQFGQEVFHGLAYWVLLAAAVSRSDLQQAEGYARSLIDPDPHCQPVAEPIAAVLRQALNACQAQDTHAAFTLLNQALEKARDAGEL